MKVPEVLLIEVRHAPGSLALVLAVLGDAGILVEGLDAVRRTDDCTIWELTTEVDETQFDAIAQEIDALSAARLIGQSDRVFDRHRGGKIETRSRAPIDSLLTLRDVYTPGVARVCLAIEESPVLAMDFTSIGNRVAIVTNGTAVLGLGDIGAVAGMPVMEGKAALFHELVRISGVPILIDDRDPGAVIAAVKAIAPSFGAIQLEDIAAPECFEIERELARHLDIPVLHDDQHGTAVVVLAALRNAMSRVGADLSSAIVGQVGLGAAGLGIARVLIECGATVVGSDLSPDATQRLEDLGGEPTTLNDVMARSDVVIATTGVAGLIGPELVREGQIILALTNPDPEIKPDEAMRGGASFAADGRTINNVLGFPGLFRGALDARASAFTGSMLIAAAEVLAERALPGQLVPDPLDRETHAMVAAAVRSAAEAGGEAMFLY